MIPRRIRSPRIHIPLAVLLLATVPPVAETAGAQGLAPAFGVRVGASFPTGDVQDELQTGYHVGVSLGFAPILLPLGVRLDATLHQLALAPHGGPGHESEELRIIAGEANVLYRLALPFAPYVIGGLGIFNSRDPHTAGDENEFGWNLGAGIRFGLADFSTFAELRYHRFETAGGGVSILPVTVGITF